jgi:hypothetical protein
MIFVSFIYKNEIQVNFGVQRREADGVLRYARFLRYPAGGGVFSGFPTGEGLVTPASTHP